MFLRGDASRGFGYVGYVRNLGKLTALILCVCPAVFALQASPLASEDIFIKYPAEQPFVGKRHPPLLIDPDARLFRTRIREGVAKGVQFAGHYQVAIWGCGSGCLSFAIIDARTGKVTFFPATISQDREMGERLTYKRQSKAIHVIGSLNEENSADRWYVWNGKAFVLISEKPAVMLDDNGDPIEP